MHILSSGKYVHPCMGLWGRCGRAQAATANQDRGTVTLNRTVVAVSERQVKESAWPQGGWHFPHNTQHGLPLAFIYAHYIGLSELHNNTFLIRWFRSDRIPGRHDMFAMTALCHVTGWLNVTGPEWEADRCPPKDREKGTFRRTVSSDTADWMCVCVCVCVCVL